CLALKIQLVQQAAPEVGQHVREFVPPSNLRVRIDELSDLFESFQVFNNYLAHPRPLNLDYHSTAVAHRGAMHLRERRCRRGLAGEIQKEFRDATAEFGRNNAFNFIEREWLDLILQPRERIEIWLW